MRIIRLWPVVKATVISARSIYPLEVSMSFLSDVFVTATRAADKGCCVADLAHFPQADPCVCDALQNVIEGCRTVLEIAAAMLGGQSTG